ncbi:unnamed protein product [Phytophthora fragariaefolia]|uniref:Unnamed protein product n=1 Tax=Phytophthora fragariaefolia TaxID=1490495 RepID=A0A9W6TP15_9STRA|nr:unnamed protein product [Phytophthora fragariaefolia]
MAVTAMQSPQHHKGAPSESSAGEFALLLVQEWLVAAKLEATARCLVDECARTERDIPARVVWNRMVENLGLGPRSPAVGGKRGGGDTTLLEAVVRRVVDQHDKDVAQTIRNHALVPHQQVVVMSRKREMRFAGKRSLPRSRSAAPSNNDNAHERSPELSSSAPSLGLRPKSAMVCKSTPDLVSNGFAGGSSKTPNSVPPMLPSTGPVHRSAKKAVGTYQRPISATGVLTPHRDALARKKTVSSSRTPRLHSPTSTKVLHGVMEAVAAVAVDAAAAKTTDRRNSSLIDLRASLPHITEAAGLAASSRADGDDDDDGDNTDPSQRNPKLSLEEMSEERLMGQFGSISRCAIKKLRRVLAKSHACSQEFEKSQRTLDKIKARAKLRQLRRVLAEEQTPLLSSTMASLTNEPCSLCLHVFPKMNLITKVSHKSIIDLRASWAVANGSPRAAVDNANGETEQSAEAMSHSRMTHLYDEASVCVFCSQLVLNYSSYRVRCAFPLTYLLWSCSIVSHVALRATQPTSAERQTQQAKERLETMKSVKDLEVQDQRVLERCDPLNFHSYELNSDDDDSDVEEIVEVKTDGRPHVVRRRRVQTRTPVQLGVVSKRLHYDKLRSDSLHMLTLDEWHKIMR